VTLNSPAAFSGPMTDWLKNAGDGIGRFLAGLGKSSNPGSAGESEGGGLSTPGREMRMGCPRYDGIGEHD